MLYLRVTIRVGRYIEGNSDMIRDLLEENDKSILILGEVRALTLLGTVYCFCTHLMVYAETIAFCTFETARFRLECLPFTLLSFHARFVCVFAN